jgi:hypothetical protein
MISRIAASVHKTMGFALPFEVSAIRSKPLTSI